MVEGLNDREDAKKLNTRPNILNTIVIEPDVMRLLDNKRFSLLASFLRFGDEMSYSEFVKEYAEVTGYSESYIYELMRKLKSIARNIKRRKNEVVYLAVSLESLLEVRKEGIQDYK